MTGKGCPFCHPDDSRIIFQDPKAYAVFDAYPVNPGHMLVIPFEHEPDFLLLSDDTRASIDRILSKCRDHLDQEFIPDGYNIGVNIGRPAGQTIMHAHVHLIPRFIGDVYEPRGGVRGVIPQRREYR
jgi:diadenosine tetraphosphate (Ap4A) HIT family hydrolase